MAEIFPFKGYRFNLENPASLGEFVSPPYDMVSPADIDRLYNLNPYNTIRIIQNRKESSDAGNKDRHIRAANLLSAWIAEGRIVRDSRPCIYAYRQRFTVGNTTLSEYVRTGIILRIRLVSFDKGIVLPHEYTLHGPKADRLELLEATRFNTGQIMGIVTGGNSVHAAITECVPETPIGFFTDENGVRHELHQCADQAKIASLKKLVANESIIIADGHHRYETSLGYAGRGGNPADGFVMMTLVSDADPGLVIRSFHRLLKQVPLTEKFTGVDTLKPYVDCAGLGNASFEKVSELLDDPAGYEIIFLDGASKRMYGLTTNESGARYLRQQDENLSEPWYNLVVSKINYYCVRGILGLPLDGTVLHDVMDYVNDLRDAYSRITDNGGYRGGFFIRPVDIGTVRGIVSRGERMPQKSTNFFPKLYSGLVFNRLEND